VVTIKSGKTGITYQLTEGSEIRFVNPTVQGSPAAPELLSGEFNLVPAERFGNTSLVYSISRISFRSESFSVTGSDGSFMERSFPALRPFLMAANVLINEKELVLSGGGDRTMYDNDSQRFTGLQVDGSGYTVTIFAAPED